MDIKRVPGTFRIELNWNERPYDPNRPIDKLKLVGASVGLLSLPWLVGFGYAASEANNGDWQGDDYVRASGEMVVHGVSSAVDWIRDLPSAGQE